MSIIVVRLRIIVLLFFLFLTSSSVYADYFDGYDFYRSGDYTNAFNEWSYHSSNGDAPSYNGLGLLYQDGLGVSKDYKIAHNMYKKAYEMGDSYGANNIGFTYENGLGVSQDYKEAFKWYKKTAENGNADGQFVIGFMYENGLGVSQDYEMALNWYRKSAKLGNSGAQNNLGVFYIEGKGVFKDYAEAFKWYTKSATNGNQLGQANLADMYMGGLGIPKDFEKAFKWYKKSAKQGNSEAQFELGYIYDIGKYISKDYEEAFKWYTKSAEQGHNLSQYNLGLMYEYGDLSSGVDYQTAIKYYKLYLKNENTINEKKELAIQKIEKLTKKLESNTTENSFSELWKQYGGDIHYIDNNTPEDVVNIDNDPPVIVITQKDNITITESQVAISGIITDDSEINKVLVDDKLVSLSSSGTFNTKLYIPFGETKVLIDATDVKGNSSTKSITITRKESVYKNKDKRLIPPLNAKTSNPSALALIIGIDKYESIANAQWAESDAGMFYDFANKSLGISEDRIKLIRGNKSDMRGIWKSVEQWLPAYIDKNRSDLYVYFAGHGLASEDGEDVYLIPWDGDPELLSRTALKRSELVGSLKKLNARNVTMFMDTCYSGKAKGGKGVLVADARGLRIVKKNNQPSLPSNFTLFSAAASDETARSHPSLKHGLFSYWMMRGLGGEADINGDNKLTNGELHSFVNKKVQQTAITIGHKQHPQLIGDKDKVIASW